MQHNWKHYSDVIMIAMASQITGISIECSTVCLGADQGKHQSSLSLAIMGGIHQWPVDSSHKRPVMRKMLPFDDVILILHTVCILSWLDTGRFYPYPSGLLHWRNHVPRPVKQPWWIWLNSPRKSTRTDNITITIQSKAKPHIYCGIYCTLCTH